MGSTRAGRIAGAAALVAIAVGAFLLWRSGDASPPPGPARAPSKSAAAAHPSAPASAPDAPPADARIDASSTATPHGSASPEGPAADAGPSASAAASSPEDARLARVTGTVAFPEEWGLRRSRIEFRGAELTTSSTEHSLHLALPENREPVPFKMPPLLPGQYFVTIDPQFVAEVTVSPQGADLHFRVPPPGTLLVSVVDASTSAPVPQARVLWHAASNRNRFRLDEASGGSTPGAFRILAPPGPVVLRASAEGYQDAEIGERDGRGNWTGTVEVTGGLETAVTLGMHLAGSVKVVLRWEDRAPKWDGVHLSLVGRNAKGQEVSYGLDIRDGVGLREGLPAGEYELRVRRSREEVDFEPLADITVTVVAGETATLEITLVRKK